MLNCEGGTWEIVEGDGVFKKGDAHLVDVSRHVMLELCKIDF